MEPSPIVTVLASVFTAPPVTLPVQFLKDDACMSTLILSFPTFVRMAPPLPELQFSNSQPKIFTVSVFWGHTAPPFEPSLWVWQFLNVDPIK